MINNKIKYSNNPYYCMESLSAIVTKEDGTYIAKCVEIGTVSQGKSIDSAIKNLREATELYLEEFPLKKHKKPLFTTFEVAGVEV